MPKISRRRYAAAAARRRGSHRGREAGFSQGYHYGRCESVRVASQPPDVPLRELKVLYIPQGFPGIDQGIITALQHNVKEVIVGTPQTIWAEAQLHQPHLVLVLNGLHVFPGDHLEQLDQVRDMGIRTAIWFADDPYFTDHTGEIAVHYDVVLTHEQGCVEFYQSLGCREVHYLPLAADTSVFRPVPVPPAYRSDICFIGMAFWNRVEVFDQIAPALAGYRVFIGGGLWERMKHYPLLRRFIRHGWIPVEESVQYYCGAKIVINLHRGHENQTDNKNTRGLRPLSINPRTYEIAACGAMQLTDVRQDLASYYTPGVDLEIYESPAELAAKLHHYLRHDAERREMAYNGLRRTLLQHSFVTRVSEMLAKLGY